MADQRFLAIALAGADSEFLVGVLAADPQQDAIESLPHARHQGRRAWLDDRLGSSGA